MINENHLTIPRTNNSGTGCGENHGNCGGNCVLIFKKSKIFCAFRFPSLGSRVLIPMVKMRLTWKPQICMKLSQQKPKFLHSLENVFKRARWQLSELCYTSLNTCFCLLACLLACFLFSAPSLARRWFSCQFYCGPTITQALINSTSSFQSSSEWAFSKKSEQSINFRLHCILPYVTSDKHIIASANLRCCKHQKRNH